MVTGTPEPYREFLKEVGGTNRLGEPNFVLMWGGDLIKQHGYTNEALTHHLNCWVLAEWCDRDKFGLPKDWPQGAGPFPYNGRYEILQVFRNGQIPTRLNSAALNPGILGQLLQIIYRSKGDSIEKKKQALRKKEEREGLKMQEKIADRIEDAVPSFGEVFSAPGQVSKTSTIRRKMEQIEMNLKRSRVMRRKIQKGLSVQGV